VEDAIEELGYSPNAIARSMARGRTHTLACFSPNLTDFTFANIIEGAENEARAQGYFLLAATAPDRFVFEELIQRLICSRQTEGLLVINPYIDRRDQCLPERFPTVFLGARSRWEGAGSVYLDEVNAGMSATYHLIELGHRRIVHLTGPYCEDCAQDRKTGYLAALKVASIDQDASLICEGDWSATSGYQIIRQLLARGVPFTGIFAQNDRMAVGAIRALREIGRSIPEDVSVIGFDDMPLASYFDPPLTTMRQDTFASGREAAQLLIQIIEHPDSPRKHVRLPAELVVRSSTARAAVVL
jgi:DNA-binding LacI/PurR family transcriptional regulator